MSASRPVGDGLVRWPPATAASYRARGWWTGETLGELISSWASNWPERVAMIDGEVTVTYAEMDRLSLALAGRLRALGIRGGLEGDAVLVQLPNSVELVLMILACLRLGSPPLLALPAHRRHELSYLAEHGATKAIVVPDVHRGFDHQSLAAEIARETPSVEHVMVVGHSVDDGHVDLRGLIASGASEAMPLEDRTPDDIAVILLSGGTTGRPKLIARTHEDYILNFRLCVAALAWDEHTTYLASLPVCHNFALAGPGVLGAFSVGGRVVLVQTPSPEAVFDTIQRHRITHAAAVPAVAQRWIDARPATRADLSSLKFLQAGGARISADSARAAESSLGVEVQQVYGMAEGYIAYTRPGDPPPVRFETQGRAISAGDELRIVDDEDRDLADGETGHILVRGPYTIRGYYRAPEHNKQAFTPDGWYRTGDLGRIHPSGNIVVEGRTKDQINRGGEKIAAQEVEELLQRVPGVSRAAIVGYPDPLLGERVGVVIVAAVGEEPDLEVLCGFLSEKGIARFKHPERLVVLDALPLTKVGKVDKVALRVLMGDITAADRPMGSRR